MKKNNDSVPRLDLAPQLKRPLYIWNPLDYLRLLYWVFFFPQALPWYVENYGGGEGFARQTTWQSKLEFLCQHPNHLKLLFQGLILTICVPYLFYILLLRTNSIIDWFPVAGGVVGAVVFSMVFDLPG
ncbi:MAG: ATP-binding protein, partial [Okeania sp. SIO2H7]|nr:ATP-binding protein [Okeania sp. SIO2H7]